MKLQPLHSIITLLLSIAILGNQIYTKAAPLNISDHAITDFTDFKQLALLPIGDINQNGETDINDGLLILKHIASTDNLSDAQLKIADANFDSYVDVLDFLKIVRIIAGLNYGFYDPELINPISLDISAIYLTTNSTFKITDPLNPILSFSSTNTSIATVDGSGTVRAVNSGICFIIVSNSSHTAFVPVYISAPFYISDDIYSIKSSTSQLSLSTATSSPTAYLSNYSNDNSQLFYFKNNGDNTVSIAPYSLDSAAIGVITANTNSQIYLGVTSDLNKWKLFINPDDSISIRLAKKDSLALSFADNKPTLQNYSNGQDPYQSFTISNKSNNQTFSFAMPVPTNGSAYISQTNHDSTHAIDIASKGGANLPIFAIADGVVTDALFNQNGYGYIITVDHLNGYVSRYAHCKEFTVAVGTSVLKGQQIAVMGSTGNSTGTHLHLEIRYNGNYIYPGNLIPNMPSLGGAIT